MPAVQQSVKDVPHTHENIRAIAYNASGRLDYRLNASRLCAAQSSNHWIVEDPTVYLVQESSAALAFGRSEDAQIVNDYTIQAAQGVFSQNEIRFGGAVLLQYHFPKKNAAVQGAIHADQFSYHLHTRAFEASGKVECMHEGQRVQAERVSGHLGEDDYLFERAKVIYRKQQ